MRKKLLLTKIDTSKVPAKVEGLPDTKQEPIKIVKKPVTLANEIVKIHKRKDIELLLPIKALQRQANLIMEDYLFDDIYYIIRTVGNSDMNFPFTFKYIRKMLEEEGIKKRLVLF